MTRVQILKLTEAVGRAVASNKTGVAPVNKNHVEKLRALKAKRAAAAPLLKRA
jgi:hypothetical protein